jgi:hypothetical protein
MLAKATMMALGLMLAAPAITLAEDAAAPAAGTGKHLQACSAEIQKFCATVEKGKGLMRKCLESHTSELSDGCKTRLAERAAEHAAKAADKAAQ